MKHVEFATQAQQDCYERIKPWLKEMFGDLVMERDEAPAFAVTHIGSQLTHIVVYPWGSDDAVVSVRSWVVTGLEADKELDSYLIRENANMRFGAFAVDSDNDIVFEHAIVGSTCDKGELKASVMAVLMTADKYDDEIVSRWGGRTALDMLKG